MFTFTYSLPCPKAYHKPDHPIFITEYHAKKLLSLIQEQLSLEYHL